MDGVWANQRQHSSQPRSADLWCESLRSRRSLFHGKWSERRHSHTPLDSDRLAWDESLRESKVPSWRSGVSGIMASLLWARIDWPGMHRQGSRRSLPGKRGERRHSHIPLGPGSTGLSTVLCNMSSSMVSQLME